MRYGVSYYPEHKKPEELDYDIQCIIESGINTVRMGEFAWCRMEPEEGVFRFDWLDDVVRKFGENGISTIICTPTACPPAWMIEKHPDILYMDNRGIRRPFGGRRHYCYNNETYRMYSARIAEKIGKHYGNNPFVAGFQIDNEPAQEGTGRCHCPVCTEKFQNWLQEKYHTIGELNERTGGVFWSQEYTSFGQIHIPVNSIEVGAKEQIEAFYENPAIRLDFERFASESQIEYQNIQANILKQYTKAFVTTNATGLATNSIDYYKSTKELDMYAFDYYPGLRNAVVDSFPYAFARGVKEGTHFGVMEFMSGGGHRFSGSGRQQPNPGALKQAVFQSLAHGADLMLHFQYRTFPFGAEQLNYAIVDMDGVPRRRYYEMKETAVLLKRLEAYEEAEFRNETAILVDYDTHWALRIKPVNDPDYNYLNYCGQIYHLLQKAGIGADVLPYDADLSSYKTVILPGAFVLGEEYREKFRTYTAEGGCLVATFLSSVKNKDNRGYTDSLPAGLTDVFGVTVQEVEPVFADNRAEVRLCLDGETYTSLDSCWCDLLEGSADMIGTYTETYKSGSGVVSENKYGQGHAWYIGTGLEEAVFGRLLETICARAGVSRIPFEIPENVEAVCRYYGEKKLYYLINFTQKETRIDIQGTYADLITGQKITGGILQMQPGGFAMLLEQ